MTVIAPHMVGEFKYIILRNLKGEEKPIEVYLEEAKITVKPDHDEEEGKCISVSTIYVARANNGSIYYPKGNEIFDTKEEALARIKLHTK